MGSPLAFLTSRSWSKSANLLLPRKMDLTAVKGSAVFNCRMPSSVRPLFSKFKDSTADAIRRSARMGTLVSCRWLPFRYKILTLSFSFLTAWLRNWSSLSLNSLPFKNQHGLERRLKQGQLLGLAAFNQSHQVQLKFRRTRGRWRQKCMGQTLGWG